MCGICGIVRFSDHDVSVQSIETMMKIMASRGPDARGMLVQGNTGLGHRRLKVFDLSEKSQQPMTDSELGLSAVYNGAIYNYKKIRKELEAKGYRFFSDGDTEVLLKAYHAWGKKALNRINGMFAFAIRHRDSGRMVLGRDRLGIKPLYYTMKADHFSFASSLPALVKAEETEEGTKQELDPVALHFYMSFHSIVPPPRTIFKDIRKLPPATIMTLEADGSVSEEKYWQLDFLRDSEEEKYSREDWKERIRYELEGAVQRRLTGDVPVGVLLSGGLDSSLLVGLLAQAGQTGLNTFSIGFEGVKSGEEYEKGDEFEYSDIIARHFGTQHHKIRVDSGEVLSSLENCVRAMSEPMVSHDCIGFYLLSREVSRHLKVVQSGQGADEVFAGYHWYPPLMQSKNPAEDYARVFTDGPHGEFAHAVHPRYVSQDYSRKFIQEHFAGPGADTAIDKALRMDTTVMLIDDPVKRVDNMTMAWGLEARVPFLDHCLVECAAKVPAEYKIREGGKYILKAIGRDVIPSEVIDRPKGYFPVPVLKYFRGPYLDFVREILRSPAVREREIFKREYVSRVLENPDAHITPLRGSRLWQMAVLEYWLSIHQI
ncbi:MAG: N-acetylglutaminylglutamine amidotransferase [Desulfococcaceae bacterium]|jgi:asparagine synthase (glutamine-hydrolysing)|nr:N-acetylglutaminylglutamine amidotransferase [Desulfococcaceae bacterium]